MLKVKTFLTGIGYVLTGRWILASITFALLGGWKYIDVHTKGRKDDEYVDAITFSNNKHYAEAVGKLK